MKKTIYVLFIVILAFVGCKSKTAYEIVGMMPDSTFNGSTVYLYESATRDIIDSAVVENGRFEIKGEVTDPALHYVAVGRTANYLILEPGVITADMSNRTVSGTALNEKYEKFSTENKRLQEEVQQEWMRIREMEDLDEEEMNNLMREAHEGYTEKYLPHVRKYFEENTNNALGAVAFTYLSYELEPAEIEEIYAQAGENVRNDKSVKKIMERIQNLKNTEEGKPFVDFTIANGNLDGTSVSLSDYVGKGKYVLVDFWASWCGPCIAEIPVLEEVYKKHAGDKFEILSVAVWNERADTEKALEKYKFPWPQILDAQSIPTDLYGIEGIPHIILFGPDGTIVKRGLRGDELKNTVAESLK